MRVGVVALEGSGRDHLAALRRLGQVAVAVERPADLDGLAVTVDALVGRGLTPDRMTVTPPVAISRFRPRSTCPRMRPGWC